MESLAQQGARFMVKEKTVTVLANATGQLCENNPQRWGLKISADGGVAGYVSTLGSVAANKGVSMPQMGWGIDLYFARDPALVQAVWFGAAPNAQSTVFRVIEILLIYEGDMGVTPTEEISEAQ